MKVIKKPDDPKKAYRKWIMEKYPNWRLKVSCKRWYDTMPNKCDAVLEVSIDDLKPLIATIGGPAGTTLDDAVGIECPYCHRTIIFDVPEEILSYVKATKKPIVRVI